MLIGSCHFKTQRWFQSNCPRCPFLSHATLTIPRLDRESEWHFMVPEDNLGTHGHTQMFISRDRHVTVCHVSSNMMEEPDSLTWTQKLLQDGRKIQQPSAGLSESTSTFISPVHYRQSAPPGHNKSRGKNRQVCGSAALSIKTITIWVVVVVLMFDLSSPGGMVGWSSDTESVMSKE